MKISRDLPGLDESPGETRCGWAYGGRCAVGAEARLCAGGGQQWAVMRGALVTGPVDRFRAPTDPAAVMAEKQGAVAYAGVVCG